jgi:hypothetical protein
MSSYLVKVCLGEPDLRYVGVIRFVFHVLHLNRLDLHNKTCVVLAN